ncbi:MAG TPA: TRAP transporter small permease [Thermodesulfobacteriota bacterium]|nr:TRAP transporter small permease [Thermodesulfobacteriota bacterium]
MNVFEKISQKVTSFENGMMIVGMCIASSMITIQVFLRYFFNYSITWAEELTRYAIIWMSFVGAGMGVRKGAHISVDLLFVFLAERWKRILTAAMAILGIWFGGVILYTGSILVFRTFQSGQISPAMEAPIFIVYLGIPLGGFILLFRCLELSIKNFKGFFPQAEVERKGGM